MKFQRNLLSAAVAAAVAGIAGTNAAQAGEYRTGDFHNHTVCSDGSTSVSTLTREALEVYDHDWFIHVGHSGRGPRDCRVEDFLYHSFGGGGTVGLWTNTIGNEAIKGDQRDRVIDVGNVFEVNLVPNSNGDLVPEFIDGVATKTPVGPEYRQVVQDMWRWQSLQEYNFDDLVSARELPWNVADKKVAFLGLEWVVPGHEHSSDTIITGQFDEEPNSDAMAQFEYCFARNSDDTSQGGGQGWTCEISDENNDKLIELFDGRPEEGIADYNSTLVNGINIADDGQHVKAAASVLWREENFPGQSFQVQAHVERQGAFLPGQNRGWDVEQMRDMNTLAPGVAFGFESQPGHQAQSNRGSYSGGRPTAGFWTYGGTGAYSAAEITKPGLDFDGNPIDPATTPECQVEGVNCSNVPRTVLSRPGVRTMWDAMLSEGRHFWFFGSSDWHNRGAFGPTEPESTNDFWPGEYQDNFTYVEDNNPDNPAQDVVDGLRSGNVFVVQGQLINRMVFKACSRGECATMGETLNVRPGANVRVTLNVRDPAGKNNSPYEFPNPILLQNGEEVPLNYPELAHVELIQGQIKGTGDLPRLLEPTDPEYFNPLAPPTTKIVRQWTKQDWGYTPTKRMTFSFRASKDGYIRARGSNIPPGTPYKRDADGNPLADNLSDNIACTDPLCPPHVDGIINFDLEAWADMWFYSNPIFIDVDDSHPYFRNSDVAAAE